MVFSNYEVEAGSVTLPMAVTKAVGGLAYVSEIVPELPEMDLQSGTTYSRMRRTGHVNVMLNQSLGFEIGRYDTEEGEVGLEQIPFRLPSNDVGEALPLFSGVKRVDFANGNDRTSDLFIRQIHPLPLTVLGIVDEVDIKE